MLSIYLTIWETSKGSLTSSVESSSPFGKLPKEASQEMAFQMWVNIDSYPDEVSTLYDNGNIRLDIDTKGWIYLYDNKGLITNITSTSVYSLKITSPFGTLFEQVPS